MRSRFSRGSAAFLLFLLATLAGFAQRTELFWPTPNVAWLEGRGIDAFVQPTVSGEITSGCFGCVRSSGSQFHEGLDLRPVVRNRQGEADDPVFAVLPGIVRHVAVRAGASSYGRYVVLEHPEVTPAVYSLYAHLAAIAPGLKPGDAVARGQTIGSMGRSAGGYVIPKERAHLHLELGLMVTREFQTWYATRKFGSRNDHGPWNGMNLMGIDPLDVFNAFRSKRVDTFDEYFASMGTAVRLRIATRRIPDFTQRYPTLVERGTDELIAGWEVSFNATGLPFHWRPLTIAQVMGYRPNEVRILETNEVELKSMRCRSLIVKRRGNPEPGPDLRTFLQQLFGLP